MPLIISLQKKVVFLFEICTKGNPRTKFVTELLEDPCLK